MAFARLGASFRVLILAAGVSAAGLYPAQADPGGFLSVFGLGDRAEPQSAAPVPVQYGDPQVTQLQEQIRTLNGRIEELGFQMLQMQEQMRQMQEDNEFRFQALEGGAPAGGGDRTAVEPAQQPPASAPPSPPQDFAGTGATRTGTAGTGTMGTGTPGTGLPGVEPDITASTSPSGSPTLGAPERQLGTMIFDEQGNLSDTIANPAANPAPPQTDNTQTAALPVDDPEALYRNAYGYVLSGDYAQAEAAFNDYIDIYPDGGQVADAHFWLGESQYSQGNFNGSAKTFLNAHQTFPTSEKAPEMLLKLGMSLAALDNRDTACATYREVLSRYPDATQAVRNKVADEQRNASC